VQRNSLKQGEILVEIQLPTPRESTTGGSYEKFATRKAIDLGIVGVGTLVKENGGIFDFVKIALASVAPTPLRARKAEAFLKGKETNDRVMREAAEIASGECSPISDIRASAEYRTELVKELTFRAIKRCIRSVRKE
jgi:carbon-monoxide dehydrogenase medium subunit